MSTGAHRARPHPRAQQAAYADPIGWLASNDPADSELPAHHEPTGPSRLVIGEPGRGTQKGRH